MMTVLTKWAVVVHFAGHDAMQFYISDMFSANVLRKVADIDFGFDKQVTEICISLAK